MGYRTIPGDPLWREKLMAIKDDQTLRRLAKQLAGFLKELHSISLETNVADLPVQDTVEEWGRMYADIRVYLFPLYAIFYSSLDEQPFRGFSKQA